jgi:hypothetical protein
LFTDALEPSHLIATHVTAALRFELFDPILVVFVEIEPISGDRQRSAWRRSDRGY